MKRYAVPMGKSWESDSRRSAGREGLRVGRLAPLTTLVLLLALIFGAPLPMASAQLPETLTLNLLQDSHTENGTEIDTNFGSSDTLQHGRNGVGPFLHTLIEWDVSSIDSRAIILDANLTVETADTGSGSFTSQVRTILGSWVESTVTFNNSPSFGSTILDEFESDVEVASIQSINVTTSVQALIGTSTFGLAFLNDSSPGKFQDWRSDEDVFDRGPVLVVTVVVPLTPAVNVLAVLIAVGVLVVGAGFIGLMGKKDRSLEDLGFFLVLLLFFAIGAGIAVALFAG